MPENESAIILAIDLGTGGPKVSLVKGTSEVLATGFAPTPLILTDDGGIEQDGEGWWTAVVEATRLAFGAAPDGTPKPSAVAVTAQWTTTIPVDENADPVMNAISWMDGRGAGPAYRAVGPAPRVSGYNPRKLKKWIQMTAGAPSLQGHDPVGQILTIAERYPDAYARTAFFLEPGDFLTARLTGNIVTAPETATMCWGTDTRDVDNIQYNDKLLAMSGLNPSKLAPIVPSGSVIGEVLPERAKELGIDPVPVTTSTPDLTSAAVGSGQVADGAMHLYVGTSSWLSAHVPFKRTDLFHNIATLPSSIKGRYLVATEQQTAGRSLEHLRNELLGMPDMPFADLVAEAEASAPGAGGTFFTPWLNGDRTPIDDNDSRASYTNISLGTSRGDLVRATLEGVAMNIRWMHHYTEKLVKSRVDDIAVIGGGAESDLWCQIISDVLDRQIRRIDQPRQANVRGAALLASVGIGAIKVEDISHCVQTDATFTPDGANRNLYDDRFDAFKGFHKANRKMFSKLNAGKGGH